MKIHTSNIFFEMSINEFEQVLEKDLLEDMIDTVATLSEAIEMGEDMDDVDDLVSLLNDIMDTAFEDEDDEMYDEYEDEFEEKGKVATKPEDSNETIEELYNYFFGNGEKHNGG
jgi:uncharacterized 2Fe-2S/4Fe-4S cluster protein (DUF4445 family)